MKTPEEIKKGLSGCADKGNCEWCNLVLECEKNSDTLDYIKQLEQRLAQAERERDELEGECRSCGTCKFLDLSFTEHPCNRCVALGRRMMWQWRGICEENSKEENNG